MGINSDWTPTGTGAWLLTVANYNVGGTADYRAREQQIGRAYHGKGIYRQVQNIGALTEFTDIAASALFGSFAYPTGSGQPDGGKNIIYAINNGDLDAGINGVAVRVKAVAPFRVFVRLFWEFNLAGNQYNPINYTDGVGGSVPGAWSDFTDAWIRVWTIFMGNQAAYTALSIAGTPVQCSANQVKWAYNPGSRRGGSGAGAAADPTLGYPGDAYVDWIWLDCYPNSPTTGGDRMDDFTTLMTHNSGGTNYTDWYSTFASYNKPMGIGECCVHPTDDVVAYPSGNISPLTRVHWWNTFLTELKASYPLVRLFTAFDTNAANDPRHWAVDTPSATANDSGSQALAAYTTVANDPYFKPAVGAWDDGKGHFYCSMDYFGSVDTSAHGVLLANGDATHPKHDYIRSWTRLDIGTNNLKTFEPAMRAANSSLVVLGYMKSDVVIPGAGKDPSNFPEAYYSHTCSGSRITQGSAGDFGMQPDATASYSDARSFSSTNWASWKAQDCTHALDNFNATYTAGQQGVMLDSMGFGTFQSQCNNGTPYTKPQWIQVLYGIADATVAQRLSMFVHTNGLSSTQAFYNPRNSTSAPTSDMLFRCRGSEAESWIRGNYDAYGVWPVSDTAVPPANRACWQNSVQMLIDGDLGFNSYIAVTVNIANTVPGNQPPGFVAYTQAQIDQWKRFSYCTFMLGQRGRSMYQFVSAASTKPWDETHTYWVQDLGTPTTSPLTTAAMRDASGLYIRKWANGNVYVNPTAAAITVIADQAYTNPDTGTSIANGAQITIPAHDAKLLLIDVSSPPDTDTPAITVTSPTASQVYAAVTPVTLTATVTDADGIATVTAQLDSGTTNTCTLVAADTYSFPFGLLSPGAHSITVRATDAYPSTPLSSSKSVMFTVLDPPPPNTSPTVNILDPGDVLVLPATALVTVTATDADGIASVTATLDGLPSVAMSLANGIYSHDYGILTEGSHRVTVTATDSNASPLSTTVPRTFLVTTSGGGTGGGSGGGQTGPPPLVISTDIGDIELRIKERGLG